MAEIAKLEGISRQRVFSVLKRWKHGGVPYS